MGFGRAAALALGLMAMALGAAHADGDPARGKTVFIQCQACHSLEAGHNGIGPSLHGIIGRKSASLPDFPYSPSMRRAGLTWDEATLKKYLPDPSGLVPGTKMTFVGLASPQQVEDVIAYLKQASQ
jgi:cytochrome c